MVISRLTRTLPLFSVALLYAADAYAVEGASRVDAVVIFSQFADEASMPIPAYAGDLFDADLQGSFSHFYHNMSSGQFRATGHIIPRRYQSRGPAADYLADNDGEFGDYTT